MGTKIYHCLVVGACKNNVCTINQLHLWHWRNYVGNDNGNCSDNEIKIHSYMVVFKRPKKDMLQTSVLLTETAKLPFPTLHTSTTTGLICTYFLCPPYSYCTLHIYPNRSPGIYFLWMIIDQTFIWATS